MYTLDLPKQKYYHPPAEISLLFHLLNFCPTIEEEEEEENNIKNVKMKLSAKVFPFNVWQCVCYQTIRTLCMGLLKVWPLSVWPKSLCDCTGVRVCKCVPVMKIKLFLSSLVCSPHQFHFWVRPNRQIIMWKSLRSRSCHTHTHTIYPIRLLTVICHEWKKSKLKLSKVCRWLSQRAWC